MVVDDLGLSFENIVRVRGALKKYVEGQMQPGDLVALVRTGGHRGRAAAELGLTRQGLTKLMTRLGIENS